MLTLLLIILYKNKYAAGKFKLFETTTFTILQRLTLGFLIAFLISFPVYCYAQEYSYTIIKGGEPIGTLSANCIQSGKQLVYTIQSRAKSSFIISIQIDVLMEEIFESGLMIHSTLVHKINGKEKVHNTENITSRGYITKNRNEKDNIFTPVVKYSMGAMYFIEPVNQRFVYSEYFQQFVPVKPISGNRYLIEFPNGNKSYYNYKKGICSAIEAHTEWLVINFKLNEDIASLNSIRKTK